MLLKFGRSLLIVSLAVSFVGHAAMADMVNAIAKAAGQPTAQEAVNFDDITTVKTSITQKMVEFEMTPEYEYECPMFSNSPYMEILSSLDRMQENLNSVFPKCDNKAQNEKLIQKSVELRNSVFEAKKLLDSGQTFKLEMTAQNMVDAAQKIQETLAVAAQAQTNVCYRSNQQFRNTVFSINETFQGIAPVVLDIISKNPALGGKLGPAVKILAGADALSKGLNFVEQIAKDSVMFDMTDPINRKNTLKNVCQYMKLYRRLESMRLLKLGQIQTVYSGYQSRIRDLSQNINEYRRRNSMSHSTSLTAAPSADAAAFAEMNASDPNYQLFTSLKTLLPDELKKLQKTQYDLELAAKDLKRPEVAQCQIIQTAKSSVSFAKTVEKLFEFGISWGELGGAVESAETLAGLNRQLTAYDEYFNEAKAKKNLSECVKLGQDWIKISLELFSEGQKMVHLFAQDQIDVADASDQIREKKVSRKELQKQNIQTNLASLKSMVQYAAFESSEIEKRAKDMHRYFFRGPKNNEIKSACEGKECGTSEALLGWGKAKYQWYINNGPIYSLLEDNEKHFTYAYKQMMHALGVLAQYEMNFAEREFAKYPRNQKTFNAQFAAEMKYFTNLTHLVLNKDPNKGLKKGSSQHRNLCMQARQMLDKYLVASTHMMASESLCNMVYPALKEENVATKLRNYCIPVVNRSGTLQRPSGLQNLIYKMVGRGRNCAVQVKGQVRDPNAPPDDFKYSPKALVDKLIEKYDNLECEEKSGF